MKSNEAGDHVRIWKYKNSFANTVPWTYVISDLNCKKIAGTFYEQELQKVRVEKVIKRKGDKLYVKWKCYDNSFNFAKKIDLPNLKY